MLYSWVWGITISRSHPSSIQRRAPSLLRRQGLRLSNCLEAQRHRINCHEYARYPRVLSFYMPLTQASPSLASSATFYGPFTEQLPSLYCDRHSRTPLAQAQAPDITFTRFTGTSHQYNYKDTHCNLQSLHLLPRHATPLFPNPLPSRAQQYPANSRLAHIYSL